MVFEIAPQAGNEAVMASYTYKAILEHPGEQWVKATVIHIGVKLTRKRIFRSSIRKRLQRKEVIYQ
jgi:hypothetical protein